MRIERKYPLSPSQAPSAIHWLAVNGFHKHHEPDTITTRYWDSPDLHCARTHMEGHHERGKLRQRAYGSQDNVFLEWKWRKGDYGSKYRVLLEDSRSDPHFILLRGMYTREVLTTACRRKYFYQPASGTRATLDTNITITPPRGTQKIYLPMPVLEIKYPDGLNSEKFLLLPFLRQAYSKYLQGIVSLNLM